MLNKLSKKFFSYAFFEENIYPHAIGLRIKILKK
jgi:hypothetical protein